MSLDNVDESISLINMFKSWAAKAMTSNIGVPIGRGVCSTCSYNSNGIKMPSENFRCVCCGKIHPLGIAREDNYPWLIILPPKIHMWK